MSSHREIVYLGSLRDLCADVTAAIREVGSGSAVLIVDIPATTAAAPDNSEYLQTFRRLVKQCPHAVICRIGAAEVSALEVLVALTCDSVVGPSGVEVQLGGKCEVHRMMNKHLQLFLGSPVAAWEGSLDLAHLCAAGDSEALCKRVEGFLPHFWMAFRNAGMAREIGGGRVDEQALGAVELEALFTFYFGPKMISIFAAFDRLSKSSSAAEAPPPLERVNSGKAIQIRRRSAHAMEVTLTSDIMLMCPKALNSKLHAVLDRSIRKVDVALHDGSGASDDAIFPVGATCHDHLFSWHRKWEKTLAALSKKNLTCTLMGSKICPPLMELFMAARERKWECADSVMRWCEPSHAYVPGPAAMRGMLSRMPVTSLRKLLILGLPVEEVSELGLVETSVGMLPAREKASELVIVPRGSSVKLVEGHPAVPRGLSIKQLDTSNQQPCAWRVKTCPLKPCSESSGKSLQGLHAWMWGGGLLELPARASQLEEVLGAGPSCSLLGYGLSLPGEEHRHSQQAVAAMLGVTPENRDHYSVLTAPHIRTRYLADLERDLADDGVDQTQLLAKHRRYSVQMLREAILKACADAGVEPREIGHLSISTSTGMLLPGLTAWLLEDESLGLPLHVSRQDIVGMGCHAGLNSMKSAATWAMSNPGKYALTCAVEVCSAHFVWGMKSKKRLGNVIVNALFGDGCSAAVLYSARPGEVCPRPAYFESPAESWMNLCVVGAIQDMVYNIEEAEHKMRFDLKETTPYHVGQGLFQMMHIAQCKGIPVHLTKHIVIHTGGQTVLECSSVALGLEGPPRDTLPYTIETLRNYGNQSSPSFMFAFDAFVKSGASKYGDVGMLITMGPGAGLEMMPFKAGARLGGQTQ